MVNKQFINGTWIESDSDTTTEVRNPANLEQVTGVWPQGNQTDARRAIGAASAAYPKWKVIPSIQRADLFRKVMSAMDRRRDEIARMITAENGKPATREGYLAYQVREPLGVVSVICPWNYPFSVPARKIPPALMSGNTVVLKPAGLTPGVGKIFAELFEEAGFPPGVINVVVGGGSTVGAEFTKAPEVRAISFTGSHRGWSADSPGSCQLNEAYATRDGRQERAGGACRCRL